MTERGILMSGPEVRALLTCAECGALSVPFPCFQCGSVKFRKSQTRPVMRPQPVHAQYHEWRGKVVRHAEHRMWCWKNVVLENIWDLPDGEDRRELASHCPFGKPGDRLWVRETWRPGSWRPNRFTVDYKADGAQEYVEVPDTNEADRLMERLIESCAEQCRLAHCEEDGEGNYTWDDESPLRWRSSTQMPRWASRITLQLTEVRVQRLQEISNEDAIAEGVEKFASFPCITPWRNYRLPKENRSAMNYSTPQASFMSLWDSINGFGSNKANPWVWALTFQRVPSDVQAQLATAEVQR